MDGRPKPVSAIGRYPECTMVVRCEGCDRRAGLRVGDLLGVRPDLRREAFYQLKLRCRACNGVGVVIGVEGWRR